MSMYTARRVLEDCQHALTLLEKTNDSFSFRVLWVAGIALARAVGHVLQHVDGKQNTAAREAVAAAYESWKIDRPSNAIFWEFIAKERNQVLKQYELGFFDGPVELLAGGQVHTLDHLLYCPIGDGPFAGEDCRDVLKLAIKWWETQLAAIEAATQT